MTGFIDCFNEIINFHNEDLEFQDNKSEYYIGYAFVMSDDSDSTDYWFCKSAENGNERAKVILNNLVFSMLSR